MAFSGCPRRALSTLVLFATCTIGPSRRSVADPVVGPRPPAGEPTLGIELERIPSPVPPPLAVGDGVITIVRVDPVRHPLRLLTARADGGSRTAPEWADTFGLTGVTNASMFMPDTRSVGLMIAGPVVNRDRVNPRQRAFLAFDPIHGSAPPVAVFGRDCPGFDLGRIRARYRVVIQSIGMLDCAGRPIPSANRRIYSAAAVGVDAAGRAVFVHTRTPFSMGAFRRILASPQVGLSGAIYVEGGPEASLLVRATGIRVDEMGSYETGFHESDDNRTFWEIPNVIAF